MKQQQQQQQSFFHLLLLLFLGVYCFCDIATAIPISDGDDDDDDNGAGLSLSGDIFATTKGEEGDTLHIVPRGGGREEQGKDLYSVLVLGKRDNNWGGLDGNGNKNEGFLALNNYSPVAGGDGGGTVVGKDGDGQTLELARFSSSSSPSFGGGDSSVLAPSSGNTPVKQQQPSDIESSAL